MMTTKIIALTDEQKSEIINALVSRMIDLMDALEEPYEDVGDKHEEFSSDDYINVAGFEIGMAFTLACDYDTIYYRFGDGWGTETVVKCENKDGNLDEISFDCAEGLCPDETTIKEIVNAVNDRLFQWVIKHAR